MVFFTLGIMAKPMLVTFPFVLLLLDYWPLKRELPFLRRIAEKVPLLALTLASCIITYLAQKSGGAIPPEDLLPFGARIANAALAYIGYLGKTGWPSSLSVFYPHPWRSPSGIHFWEIGGALAVFALISFLSIRWARRYPYLAVGWLWYVGTLVPVIGLVQVGGQAMADRYTYIPLIGIFIMIAWGAFDLLAGWKKRHIVLGVAGGAALALLAATAHIQAAHWRNSLTLFGHALEATSSNALAHFNMGSALAVEGKTEEAISHYREALRINPAYLDARYNLANALERSGRIPEAIATYNQVLRVRPGMVKAHNNLGIALAETGRLDDAIGHFREVLRLDPGNAEAIRNLGIALQNKK
jgi:Flp pilus assembly protein TadD